MIFKREKYLKEIYASINKNEKLVILYGARQVGKTTLLKILLIDEELLGEKKYINFDDIYDKEFKNKDEFIKFLEFKNINTKYLNFENYEEFMFEKIEKYLEEYYLFGGYPAVILEKTKKEKIEKLSEIIDIYLKKDITFFLSGNDLISFKKMFIYLANNISSSLNISRFSSFLGISRDKTEKYLDILEKSFLLHKVYPFYSDSRKEYSKQTEFFLSDLGIINYFRNNFDFIEFDGNIIENFVYLELLKNKQIFSDKIKTYNKINGSEIDFIYESKMGALIPIEVKLSNGDIIPKIFNTFLNDYGKKINYSYRTSTNMKKERIIDIENNNFSIKIFPFWLIGKIEF